MNRGIRATGKRRPRGDVVTVRHRAGFRFGLNGKAGASRPEMQWQQEAARLAREYLCTGRESHRGAFERHMGGILARAREAYVARFFNQESGQ
jgi:hypothetical protein